MSESPEPSSTPLPPSGDSGDSGPVPHLEWDAFPWHHFRGYTKSQRAGKLKSWIWSFGFDIEHQANVDNRLWVCRRLPKGSTTNKRSIAQFFNLDANDQKEQAFINKLKNQFDKDVFQSLLLAWITESNVAFRAVEAPRFRRLLEYLNPSIALTQAHMTHSTIRTKLFQEYHQYKHIVIKELRERPGQIHLAFDGWRSPNRYALNGIAAFYLSKEKRPQKIILGLPELRESHTGENIASQVAEVIESFEIQDKIGYFTLDNAKNNDTAVAALGHVFNFEGKQRRVRCFGHIINLVAKALLFGKDNEVFKSEERLDLDLARHDLWRKRGPIGKLHNLVHWIHQSDRLTYMLRDLQRKRDSTKKPVDVLTDNMTRWLSHYKMMDRALLLHDFLDDLVALEQFEYTRSRSKKKDMPACLRDSDLLTGNDWTVISHFRNILKHFENAIKALEGDAQIRVRKGGNLVAYGTAWDIIQAFEYLLERLEEAKEFAKDVPDSEHFAINVELGWKKLEKYYIKLVECPVYYAAVALHPALRLQWFEEAWAHRPEWVLEARRIVRGIWERDYKSLILSDDEAIPMVKRRKVDDLNEFQQFRLRHRLQAGQTATTRRGPPTADEFDRWTVDIGADDGDITDPFQYWQLKESTYPRLARMAFDMLSIPPMSAECERAFSFAGLMVTRLRSRLQANTINAGQAIRSWLKAGLIPDYQGIIDASVDDDVFPEEVPHEGREVDGVEDLK
ncbi:transposase-like protein [Hirsutella rhossiliensis]